MLEIPHIINTFNFFFFVYFVDIITENNQTGHETAYNSKHTTLIQVVDIVIQT